MRALAPYLDILAQYTPDDSVSLRKVYTQYAYRIKQASNDLNSIIDLYQVAARYHSRDPKSMSAWYVENVLGTLYNQVGDHTMAHYYYAISRERLEQQCDEGKQSSCNQLVRQINLISFLYYWQNDAGSALSEAQNALRLAQLDDYGQGIATSYLSLCRAALLDQSYEEAQHYLDSMSMTIEGLPLGRHRAWLEDQRKSQHIDLLKARGDYSEVVARLLETTSDQQDRFAAKHQVQLAKAYIQIDSLDKARAILEEGYNMFGTRIADVLTGQYPRLKENTLVELGGVLATYYAALASTESDIVYYDSVLLINDVNLAIADQIRQSFIQADSKTLINQDIKGITQTSIDAYYTLSNSGRSVDLSHVDALIDHGKNALLQDYSRERAAIRQWPVDKQKQLARIQDSITMLSLVDQGPPSDLLIRLEQEEQALLGAVLSVPPPKLGKYISYFEGTHDYYSIDNLAGELRLLRLGHCDSVNASVREILALTESKDDRHLPDLLETSYQILLGQHGVLPSTVSIYPDGELAALPFAALRKDDSYVVEEHTIRMAYVDSGLDDEVESSLLAVSPHYPKVDYSIDRSGLYHLPYAQEEVRLLQQRYPQIVTVADTLDRASFLSEIKEYGHLHFAGHAVVRDNQAYLALADDAQQWVSVKDLRASKRLPPAVVLSACATGRGVAISGEGINSLARGFLHGGTRYVLYTLWTIYDLATAKIINTFYSHLDDGHSWATSIAKSQRHYLATAPHNLQHPYYWAAFTVTAPANRPQKTASWGSLLVVVLALVGGWFIYRLKTKRNATT
jgi:hypothetical protein